MQAVAALLPPLRVQRGESNWEVGRRYQEALRAAMAPAALRESVARPAYVSTADGPWFRGFESSQPPRSHFMVLSNMGDLTNVLGDSLAEGLWWAVPNIFDQASFRCSVLTLRGRLYLTWAYPSPLYSHAAAETILDGGLRLLGGQAWDSGLQMHRVQGQHQKAV